MSKYEKIKKNEFCPAGKSRGYFCRSYGTLLYYLEVFMSELLMKNQYDTQ